MAVESGTVDLDAIRRVAENVFPWEGGVRSLEQGIYLLDQMLGPVVVKGDDGERLASGKLHEIWRDGGDLVLEYGFRSRDFKGIRWWSCRLDDGEWHRAGKDFRRSILSGRRDALARRVRAALMQRNDSGTWPPAYPFPDMRQSIDELVQGVREWKERVSRRSLGVDAANAEKLAEELREFEDAFWGPPSTEPPAGIETWLKRTDLPRPVYVEWVDSARGPNDWHFKDDIARGVCQCRSVAWLVAESSESISITPSIAQCGGDGDAQHLGEMTIPRCAVTKLVNLSLKENRDEGIRQAEQERESGAEPCVKGREGDTASVREQEQGRPLEEVLSDSPATPRRK